MNAVSPTDHPTPTETSSLVAASAAWIRLRRVAVARGDPCRLQSSGLRRLRGTRRGTPGDNPLRRASA